MVIEQAALSSLHWMICFILSSPCCWIRSLNPYGLRWISSRMALTTMKKKIAALKNTNAELVKGNQLLRQENSRVSNALNQMKAAHDEQEQI